MEALFEGRKIPLMSPDQGNLVNKMYYNALANASCLKQHFLVKNVMCLSLPVIVISCLPFFQFVILVTRKQIDNRLIFFKNYLESEKYCYKQILTTG